MIMTAPYSRAVCVLVLASVAYSAGAAGVVQSYRHSSEHVFRLFGVLHYSVKTESLLLTKTELSQSPLIEGFRSLSSAYFAGRVLSNQVSEDIPYLQTLPDISHRTTVVNFALMSSDAYLANVTSTNERLVVCRLLVC